jgi:glutamyl-tRNA synthetase
MFDWQKLDWLNGHYIRALAAAELARRLEPFLPELPEDLVLRAVPALQERLRRLADARELLEYLWRDPPPPSLDSEAAEKVRAARAALAEVEWQAPAIENALEGVREERGWSKNALFKPLRLVVTGREISPPIDWTLALLSRDEALRRLDRVLG